MVLFMFRGLPKAVLKPPYQGLESNPWLRPRVEIPELNPAPALCLGWVGMVDPNQNLDDQASRAMTLAGVVTLARLGLSQNAEPRKDVLLAEPKFIDSKAYTPCRW